MKALQTACIIIAIALAYSFSPHESLFIPNQKIAVRHQLRIQGNGLPEEHAQSKIIGSKKDQARIEIDASDEPTRKQDLAKIETPANQQIQDASIRSAETAPEAAPPRQDLTYLAYYAYSEVPPDKKPADTILESLRDVPAGTTVEEIKHACDALGLDFTFMKAVAKIESDFDPTQRTGSYIGLFQLSHYEFDKYGSGDILNARDNAIAAVYKFTTAAILFELSTHKKATLSDLYLIHQQGTQGAEEHVSHPQRIAWQSMCATDEGREKGEKWCKRAIWANTLPDVKHAWKSVENLTSGAFVKMWQTRVDLFYSRYSDAAPAK